MLAFLSMLVAAFTVAASGGIAFTAVPVAPEYAARTYAGATDPTRGSDLLLYDRVVRRLQAGESYYAFIAEEQRLSGYPVTPGAAVRLPTLAVLHAAAPPALRYAAALLLLGGLTLAWIYRLGREGLPGPMVAGATILLMLGAAPLLAESLHVLHEVWAGPLIALALAIHRPGRWVPSLLVAALALSIRELVLPVVLLMAAAAFWRRDWREAAAWSALVVVFGAAYAAHLWMVEQQVLPSDAPSPGWLAMGGLGSWLTKLVFSSPLCLLPPVLAGPLAICALVGWAGWRSPAGGVGTLLLLGYGLAFMLAGRPENFYWGLLVVPVLFIGLAFAPVALRSLVKAARLRHVLRPDAVGSVRHVPQGRGA